MDAGLIIVLAVLGVFLLVPLAFAWVSTNPRRWARVERTLGRDLPTANDRVPPWLPWMAVFAGVIYLLMGVGRLLTDERRRLLGAFWMLQGAAFVTAGIAQHHAERRRRRERVADSAQTQVQDRAEAGGPGAGG